jgi:hypothetical protein
MSTVIGNGYMMKSKNMTKLLKMAKNIKENVTDLIEDEICEEAYVILRHILRRHFFSKDEKKNTSLNYELLKEIRKLDTSEFQADLILIPIANKTLILTYIPVSSDKEKEVMAKEKNILSYCYWNNTDREEGVSNEEWMQREEDWSVLGYDAPVDVGFGFRLFDGEKKHMLMTKNNFKIKLEKRIGSIEKMKEKIAKDHIIDEIVTLMNIYSEEVDIGISKALELARKEVSEGKKEQEIKEKIKMMKEIKTFKDLLELTI